jgi:ubiquinone/menaquinone biosynthesis C-methylase UbiE
MNTIQLLLGQTDIYLVDQLMKNRYKPGDVILDAGCGTGRNLHLFVSDSFNIYGIDSREDVINELKLKYPQIADKFFIATVEDSPFTANYFDHIISSAVLHLANSTEHFHNMMAEMLRLLKPGGTLFIRMTSNIGIEERVQHLRDGVYLIPDGSKRFLLTRTLLKEVIDHYKLSLIEPFKTINVDDDRCMSTLLLQKEKS